MALFFTKKPLFQNKNLLHETFFLLSSYFHTHPITQLLEILGGRMHGRPHLNFGRNLPPVPPKSQPMFDSMHRELIRTDNGDNQPNEINQINKINQSNQFNKINQNNQINKLYSKRQIKLERKAGGRWDPLECREVVW